MVVDLKNWLARLNTAEQSLCCGAYTAEHLTDMRTLLICKRSIGDSDPVYYHNHFSLTDDEPDTWPTFDQMPKLSANNKERRFGGKMPKPGEYPATPNDSAEFGFDFESFCPDGSSNNSNSSSKFQEVALAMEKVAESTKEGFMALAKAKEVKSCVFRLTHNNSVFESIYRTTEDNSWDDFFDEFKTLSSFQQLFHFTEDERNGLRSKSKEAVWVFGSEQMGFTFTVKHNPNARSRAKLLDIVQNFRDASASTDHTNTVLPVELLVKNIPTADAGQIMMFDD